MQTRSLRSKSMPPVNSKTHKVKKDSSQTPKTKSNQQKPVAAEKEEPKHINKV
jgi:hypothetical protein